MRADGQADGGPAVRRRQRPHRLEPDQREDGAAGRAWLLGGGSRLDTAILPTRFCDFSTLTTDCAMVSLATMTALMSGVLAEHFMVLADLHIVVRHPKGHGATGAEPVVAPRPARTSSR